MQKQIEQLTQRFQRIAHERMRGLPFYNSNLQVEALGFTEVRPGYLGVLITPWFINLILLFRDQSPSSSVVGHRYTHKLPSGEQDFMIGEDEELGRYDFISLASPTSKYKSQQQAQNFALQKLRALLTVPGDTDGTAAQVEEKPINFVSRSSGDMSRRSFLTGKNVSG